MRYVVEQYWVWIAVAIVIGLTVGGVAARQERARPQNGWVQAYVLLALVGGAVVYSGVVRATAGLWFETFVLLNAAYLLGCIIGSALAPRTAVLPARKPHPGA